MAITRHFAKYEQYYFCSTSSNANWRIWKEQPTELWGTDEKSAFVFALYLTALEDTTVLDIFGTNLFTEPELLSTYRELLGIEGIKPFECVGTPKETTYAFLKCFEEGKMLHTDAMEMFKEEVLPTCPSSNDLEAELYALTEEHKRTRRFYSPTLNMRLQDLANKTVCMVGFGREGRAVVKVLEQRVPSCEITIADGNENIEVDNNKHWLQIGSGWLKNLDKFDVVIVSPGVPPCEELDAVASKSTNSTDIFLSEAKENDCLVIGITGSKGKSTTSSLLAHVLQHCLQNPIYLVGNIGEPSIAHVKDMQSGSIFVLEMSSYQLLKVTQSPSIAAITSFFPDHLDYHGKEADVRAIADEAAHHEAAITAYKRAKKRIAQFQTDDDKTFFDGFTEGAKDIAAASGGMTIETYASDSPVTIEQTNLIGEHNLRNIGLVRCIAEQIGCNLDAITEAITTFYWPRTPFTVARYTP